MSVLSLGGRPVELAFEMSDAGHLSAAPAPAPTFTPLERNLWAAAAVATAAVAGWMLWHRLDPRHA